MAVWPHSDSALMVGHARGRQMPYAGHPASGSHIELDGASCGFLGETPTLHGMYQVLQPQGDHTEPSDPRT